MAIKAVVTCKRQLGLRIYLAKTCSRECANRQLIVK